MPAWNTYAVRFICLVFACTGCANTTVNTSPLPIDSTKPLFRDFMGINAHVTFKPALYATVCRLVRSYHNIDWDATAPGDSLHIPLTLNHINWQQDVYGPWKATGFETDICLQFNQLGPANSHYRTLWTGHESWAYQYGKAMAAWYGPSGKKQLNTSFEIDNEPGNRFDPQLYRRLFKEMATGIRAGDPKVRIVTPAVTARHADDYSQGLNDMYADPDILPLYDVINLHTYPILPRFAGNDNSWNRSYPEDRSLDYLRVVDAAVAWRNRYAKEKDIWITEFGYDACTPAAMQQRKDWALKLNWQGVSDLQQAQYLVRSFLLFAAMDIQRAYLFYYNDEDEASVHAASGLTRHFIPKPSFWAVKQLYETLGDYRFNRIVKKQDNDLYVYEFVHSRKPGSRMWVAWSPTGTGSQHKEGYVPKEGTVVLDQLPSPPQSIIGMATTAGVAPEIPWQRIGDSVIQLVIGESPLYIVME
ncbi:hypothetical protein ACDQ55_12565 [Chitinophaga sp. 30R24]|uniref:hypothetical protein n=1 Tax=Chitinophaga sp. 30R24 TaxID=3248838 RepID=UPI003B915FC9